MTRYKVQFEVDQVDEYVDYIIEELRQEFGSKANILVDKLREQLQVYIDKGSSKELVENIKNAESLLAPYRVYWYGRSSRRLMANEIVSALNINGEITSRIIEDADAKVLADVITICERKDLCVFETSQEEYELLHSIYCLILSVEDDNYV